MAITVEKVSDKIIRYTKPINPEIRDITLDELRAKLNILQDEKQRCIAEKQNYVSVMLSKIDNLQVEIDEIKALILECKNLNIISELDEYNASQQQ